MLLIGNSEDTVRQSTPLPQQANVMSMKKALLLTVLPWILCVSTLHAWLNLDLFRRKQQSQAQFKVGFLPVT